MKKVFATTKNVSLFYAGMEAVEEPIRGRVGMALVYGLPGTGKTEICQKYASDNDIPYIRADSVTTKSGILSKIVGELGEDALYRSRDVFDQAATLLLTDPKTLIVDEVDYLCNGGVVEVLRDLNDVTNAAVVLVGMNSIDRKLKRYPHLWDRIHTIVHFETFDVNDVFDLAKQICEINISPKAVEIIHKRSEGKFRRVLKWFSVAERMAKSSGLDFIEADHLRELIQGGYQ